MTSGGVAVRLGGVATRVTHVHGGRGRRRRGRRGDRRRVATVLDELRGSDDTVDDDVELAGSTTDTSGCGAHDVRTTTEAALGPRHHRLGGVEEPGVTRRDRHVERAHTDPKVASVGHGEPSLIPGPAPPGLRHVDVTVVGGRCGAGLAGEDRIDRDPSEDHEREAHDDLQCPFHDCLSVVSGWVEDTLPYGESYA